MRRLLLLSTFALAILGCETLRAVPESVPGVANRSPSISEDKRQAFSRALDRLRHQDFAAASQAFAMLVKSYPQLIDHHLYFGALANVRLDRGDDAERLLRRLLDEFPDSVHAAAAQVELARLLLAHNQIDGARALLYRAVQAADASVAQPARLSLAEAEERAGNASTAYNAFANLRKDLPNTAIGRVAKEHILTLRITNPEFEPLGRDRFDEAKLLLQERDFAAAEKLAQVILAQPAGLEPATIMRLQADALYGEGRIEPALKILWAIGERYPQSDEASGAMFRVGTILWNRDHDAAALRAFEDFRQRYPRHDKALEAQYAIGRIHQQAGRREQAQATYSALARSAPQSKLGREARWRIGWMDYADRDWHGAAAVFSAMRGSGTDAAYWQARSLGQAGDTAGARKLYREIIAKDSDSYYGLLADRRLSDATGPLRLSAAPITAPGAVEAPATPFVENFHLPRFEELRRAGQHTLARAELAALERSPAAQGAIPFLARAYLSVDGYNDVSRLAKRNRSSLSGVEGEQLRYPLAFWNIVTPQASALGIDPLLVVSIMRQESNFDPSARSPADARGLLQLLPSTAERVAAGAGNFAVDPSRLEEPEINIELGVRYLQSLSLRYAGDPIKMIAAYNGGETAVDKWQDKFGDAPPDEFVENISFRETRDYVKRVLSNYQHYRSLYGCGDH